MLYPGVVNEESTRHGHAHESQSVEDLEEMGTAAGTLQRTVASIVSHEALRESFHSCLLTTTVHYAWPTVRSDGKTLAQTVPRAQWCVTMAGKDHNKLQRRPPRKADRNGLVIKLPSCSVRQIVFDESKTVVEKFGAVGRFKLKIARRLAVSSQIDETTKHCFSRGLD